MRQIKIIIAIAVLATAVCSVSDNCASAQTGDDPAYIVSILVTEEDGMTPLSGAEVMFRSGEILVAVGITGADGYFYTKMPEGTYDVYAFYPGKSGRMRRAEKIGYTLSSESALKLVMGNNHTR